MASFTCRLESELLPLAEVMERKYGSGAATPLPVVMRDAGCRCGGTRGLAMNVSQVGAHGAEPVRINPGCEDQPRVERGEGLVHWVEGREFYRGDGMGW